MSKFDLERALKGEPVVLRDGTKAYIRHHETELDAADSLIGYKVRGGAVDALQWTESGRYYWDEEVSSLDIVGMWVEPLVFEHWDLLNEDIKYLAKDGDGRWFGYSRKPSKDEEGWGIVQRVGGFYSLVGLNPDLFPECPWGHSLIERPKND